MLMLKPRGVPVKRKAPGEPSDEGSGKEGLRLQTAVVHMHLLTVRLEPALSECRHSGVGAIRRRKLLEDGANVSFDGTEA